MEELRNNISAQKYMKYTFTGLRKQRFKETNERLNGLKASDVRNYMLKKGYYPEEQYLPSDFYNSIELSYIPKQYSPPFNVRDIKVSNPVFLEYPKTQYTNSSLGIPDPSTYTQCVDFIIENWKDFKKLLKLDIKKDLIIPYSIPLFYEDAKRSELSINNFKQFQEFDMREMAHKFDYQLSVDIKSFYPSTYTHAIAWAVDDVTRTNFDNSLFGNQVDTMIRGLNGRKSLGLLIGPHVSDLISEIVLRKVDKIISELLQVDKNNFIAGRYKDDYIFLTKSEKLSKKILRILQTTLTNDFNFHINETKTKIIKGFFSENIKDWKVESIRIQDEIKAVKTTVPYITYTESQLSNWLSKTKQMHINHGDPYIVKSILGTLINSDKENITAIKINSNFKIPEPYERNTSQVYVSVLENIYDLCKRVPSTWPYFFIFIGGCLNKDNPDYSHIKSHLVDYLRDILGELVTQDATFILIWCLYIFWRLEIKIDPKTKLRIKKKFNSNWIVMSMIDYKYGEHIIAGKTYKLINTDLISAKPIFKLVSVFTYRDRITNGD